MEDQEIVALYWSRSQQAILESQQKYGSFCTTLARNILPIRQDAEECVNDTWHRAWVTIPPQRPESLRAYLGKIVRNLSIDRWRHDKAQKRGEGMDVMLSELEGCLSGGTAPEEELENREITAAIQSWLNTLSREERALFLRRYWYGTSVQELAALWGCSANAVSQRLFKLRNRLKRHLEAQGVWL